MDSTFSIFPQDPSARGADETLSERSPQDPRDAKYWRELYEQHDPLKGRRPWPKLVKTKSLLMEVDRVVAKAALTSWVPEDVCVEILYHASPFGKFIPSEKRWCYARQMVDRVGREMGQAAS